MGVPLLTRFALLVNVLVGVPALITLILGVDHPLAAFTRPFYTIGLGLDLVAHRHLINVIAAGGAGIAISCLAGLAAYFTGARVPAVGAVPLVGAAVFHFVWLVVMRGRPFPPYEIYGKTFVLFISTLGFLNAHVARHGGVVPKGKRS